MNPENNYYFVHFVLKPNIKIPYLLQSPGQCRRDLGPHLAPRTQDLLAQSLSPTIARYNLGCGRPGFEATSPSSYITYDTPLTQVNSMVTVQAAKARKVINRE